VTDDGASVSVDWRKRDDGGPGPGPAPANACGAETPGAARAACYLAAIASGAKAMPAATRGARRSSKRIAQRAAAARKTVLQLEKKATTRRVAKARQATLAVAAAIERARTKGDVAPGSADGLAAMATAATVELAGL
jgi:ABC-type branched-subunit amino acid transport system substrate-binding protein